MYPSDDLGDQLHDVQVRSAELQSRAVRTASAIADTEEHGADLYQAMAEQREDQDPEHALRLRTMSEHAREFARAERRAGQPPL